MSGQHFPHMLRDSARAAGNIACMGLDPVVEALPESYRFHGINGAISFFAEIFDRMVRERLCPAAFKLNAGFFVQHDTPRVGAFSGSHTLAALIELVREMFPGVPVILDSKRGDIERSSANYAREGFLVWDADAVTVSPYMGRDSVQPFLQQGGLKRGVYVVAHTPNPGARVLQDLIVEFGGERLPLSHAVAHEIVQWSLTTPCLGAVVGATPTVTLGSICRIFAKTSVFVLIPGVGAQGGDPGEVMAQLRGSGVDVELARVSSSSDLTHCWHNAGYSAPHDYSQVCVDRLRALISHLKVSTT